jgi:DNA-binding NarL/FixJ family response regulator
MNHNGLVIIVDDESHVRTYLRLVCEKRLGLCVFEAADAAAGLAGAERCEPSLILLDVNLPRMSGVVALREFRRRFPKVPVVMITAQANPKTVQECLQGGASAFLRKDTPIEEIFNVISSHSPGELVATAEGAL